MPACHAGDRRFESGRVRHSSHFPTPRPPARTGRSSVRRRADGRFRPVRGTSVTLRPVKRNPVPVVLGLVLAVLVAVLAFGQLGLAGGSTAASAGPTSIAAGATPEPRETPAASV